MFLLSIYSRSDMIFSNLEIYYFPLKMPAKIPPVQFLSYSQRNTYHLHLSNREYTENLIYQQYIFYNTKAES